MYHFFYPSPSLDSCYSFRRTNRQMDTKTDRQTVTNTDTDTNLCGQTDISTRDTNSVRSSLTICRAWPIFALGNESVNEKICSATPSRPSSAWKVAKKGLERNAWEDEYTSVQMPTCRLRCPRPPTSISDRCAINATIIATQSQ